ncbi:MAG: hypothetical protein FD189_1699, partial [Elusimicrobia bacterium]
MPEAVKARKKISKSQYTRGL